MRDEVIPPDVTPRVVHFVALHQWWPGLARDRYRVRRYLQARQDTDFVVTFKPKPIKGTGTRRAARTPSRWANIPLQPNELAHGVFLPEKPSDEAPPRHSDPDPSDDDGSERIRRQLRGGEWWR